MRVLLILTACAFASFLSCASDPESDAIEELSGLSMVYVPIDAQSLLSLTSAVEEKGYGEVTARDFKRQFVYAEARFGRALVAYSLESSLPESRLFEPMSVTQWLRAALADPSASGVMLDPQRAIPLTLEKSGVSRALAEIPAQPDAPMELRR